MVLFLEVQRVMDRCVSKPTMTIWFSLVATPLLECPQDPSSLSQQLSSSKLRLLDRCLTFHWYCSSLDKRLQYLRETPPLPHTTPVPFTSATSDSEQAGEKWIALIKGTWTRGAVAGQWCYFITMLLTGVWTTGHIHISAVDWTPLT